MIAITIFMAIINDVVDAVNIYGNDVGVFAYKGTTFNGSALAATVLMLLFGFVKAFEPMEGIEEWLAT